MNDRKWLQYEGYVRDVMADQGIAGVSVAVTQKGNTIYSGAFGMRDIAKGLPVTTDTIFGCASVSKSFSALAITQLGDQGKLCTEDPVIKYLPEFKLRGLEDMDSVKVRHLLSHTTGLPPMTRRPNIKTWEQHMEYLATADYKLLGKPGDYFSYCNDTFLLLGAIIERLSGMPYRQYMTEKVLKAIDMPRTTYDINEVPVFGNYTELYVKNPATGVLEAKPWVELGLYDVGGAVRSNVNALMRYGQMYANDGVIDGRRIASAEGIRKMRTPVYKRGVNTSYCFALETTPDYGGYTLVEHGGAQPGVSSNFGFVPEKGIACAVLTNVTGVPASSLWLAAMNTALDLPLDKQRADMPTMDVAVSELKRYEGTYKSAEGAHNLVYLEGDRLMLIMEGETLPLRPTHNRTFAYYTAGQEKAIKFYVNGDDLAWAAFNGSRMLQRT